MGGSPPPGSKKGGYKPVVRSCVEKTSTGCTLLCCTTKDEKTYEFDYKIPGNPKDKDALFLKDIHESTVTTGGFFGIGGTTYKVYDGERICDYYLGALELPKPSDPKN